MKKFIKLASIFLAVSLTAVSCDVLSATKELTSPNAITTDKGIYELPVSGGEVRISITSAYDWSSEIEAASSIDDITGMYVSPDYAVASVKPVYATVKASENTGYDRAALVSFIGTGGSCAVTVRQAGQLGARTDKVSVADFLSKPVDASVFYELTGTITSITNDKYNDFNLSDGTGEILVYGLYNGRGGASLPQYYLKDNGITAGYTVKIQAARGEYSGTPEAVKAFLVEDPQPPVDPIIICEAPDQTIAAATTTASFNITVKNLTENWKVTPIENYSWVKSYTAEGKESGTIEIEVEPNTSKEDDRTAIFTVSSKGAEPAVLTLTQELVPDIYDVNITEFKAAEVSADKWYRITGMVTKIENDTYGNLYIADAGDTVYVYGVLPAKGSSDKKGFKTLGIKEHDVLTIVGNRGEKAGVIEMDKAYYESNKTTTPVSLAEFSTKEDSNDIWYEVTGAVTSIVSDTYGNLYLNDGTSDDVYAYGCYIGWGAKGDQKKMFKTLGINVGDEITMICTKGTFKGAPEIVNGIFVSKNVKPVPVEPTFTVSPTTLNATYTQTSASFNIGGNVAWTVTCPAGVVAEPASGEGETEVTLKFAENKGDKDIKYEITVATKAEVEVPTVKVVLNQAYNRLPATVAELIAAIPEDATTEQTAQRFDVNLKGMVVSGIYQDKNIMLEDETGGIQLVEEGSAYFNGAVISGKASVKAYAKQGRAVITSLDKCKITGYAEVPCAVLTIDELKSDLNSYIGKRVQIKDVKVSKQCKSSSKNADRQGEISQGTSSIMLYTYHTENEVWITKDSEGSVTGYPLAYVSGSSVTPELVFWGGDDFKYTVCKTVVEGMPETLSLVQGDKTSFKATSNSTAAVQYSSDNPSVATVDPVTGEINAVAKGSCNVTASVPAAGAYQAASAVCAVTVTAFNNVTLSFPDDNSKNNKSGTYAGTWKAVIGANEFVLDKFNNNSWNNNWNYVKCGHKTTAYVASIADTTKINYAVSKISVKFKAISKVDKVNSVKLIIAKDNTFDENSKETVVMNIEKSTFLVSNATKDIVIASPAKDLYYKLVFDIKATGANGNICIESVTYVK